MSAERKIVVWAVVDNGGKPVAARVMQAYAKRLAEQYNATRRFNTPYRVVPCEPAQS